MSAKQKKSTPATASIPTQVARTTSASLPRWAPLAVLVFTAFLYIRALDNGFTFIDDDYYILKNYYLRDFSLQGVKAIFTHFYSYNYHPLTSLTNLVEYRLFGLNPMPYHLFNVMLHLLNVWLVYKVTEQLSGKSITAMVVCILFAVHPMHVESVVWAAERKDVLYTAFYLASILLYQRYTTSGFRAKYYVYALLLFIGSLLSKSAAVTLPVLLIAIDVYKGRTINAKAMLDKVPFLLLAVLFGVLAILSQNAGGAISDIAAFYNPITRIFLFTSGLAAYFIHAVLPFGFSAIHYFPDLHGGSLPWYYYLSLPFLAGLAWVVARNSPYRREAIFGVLFFLITISVMLQIITVGAAIYSERYTYVSYIGLFYIVGQYIADKWESRSANMVISVFSAFVLLFSIQSWARIPVWKNSDVLFADITDKNPNNWRNSMVYYYWGLSKMNDGMALEAIDRYTKAIQLKPGMANAYLNRGYAYNAMGDVKSAIVDYTKTIALDAKKSEAYNSRGWARYETGDKTGAIADLTAAISLDPKYTDAYNNRGWVYYDAGDNAKAIADYTMAIQLSPSFTKPYYNRAAIRIKAGEFQEAIKDYNTLIKLNQEDATAYLSRGVALMSLKDNAACLDFRKAAELGNRDAPAMIYQYCK